jgi:hypothetical protein
MDAAQVVERAESRPVPRLVGAAVGAEDDVVGLEVPPRRAARRRAAEAVAGEVAGVVDIRAPMGKDGDDTEESMRSRIARQEDTRVIFRLFDRNATENARSRSLHE